jgi:hypothetical protein
MQIIRDVDIWYVCHNSVDVYHYGFLPASAPLISGQPFYEEFSTEAEMLEFIPEQYKN